MLSGGIAAVALASPVVATASPPTKLERSTWQMSADKKIVDLGKAPSQTHGDPAFYADAAPPAVDDKSWVDAPNKDYIGFGGDQASLLKGKKCFEAVNYTYFQTIVSVPANTEIETFNVTFQKIDDGARITVYNTDHPEGQVNEKSYVKLNQTSSSDLAADLKPGEDNRIVITQLDDCPVGNNLGRADIVMKEKGQATPKPLPIDEAPASDPSAKGTPTSPPKKVDPITVPLTSHGDVHIHTPDNLVYDFQATGDFLLLRDTTDTVVVQARQTTWDKNPKVSVNTGGALDVAGDKLEFYIKPDRSFELNDQKMDLPTSDFTLPKGGQVSVTGADSDATQFVVTWPGDPIAARVIMRDDNMDIGVRRDDQSLTLEGLLGNLDGDPSNDMRERGGDLVATPIGNEELMSFGDTWRLAENESLFTDPVAPEPAKNPEDQLTANELDAAEVSAAKTACTDAGVNEQLSLDNCTYDVAATGSKEFIESAKTQQEAVLALPPAEREVVQAQTSAQQPPAQQTPTQQKGQATSPLSNPLIWVGAAVVLVIIVVVAIVGRRRRTT